MTSEEKVKSIPEELKQDMTRWLSSVMEWAYENHTDTAILDFNYYNLKAKCEMRFSFSGVNKNE